MKRKITVLPGDGQSIITVRVSAGARANLVKMVEQADGSMLFKVYVTVVAEKGKANAAVIGLLAKELNISKSNLTIISGHSSRDKKIRIDRH